VADRLRVVIDTNHIISAILSKRGASAKLIDWLTRDEDYIQLLLSDPIWNEYKTVAKKIVRIRAFLEVLERIAAEQWRSSQ
jgi:putative PIN family toxin of toxin-antitoxin system